MLQREVNRQFYHDLLMHKQQGTILQQSLLNIRIFFIKQITAQELCKGEM